MRLAFSVSRRTLLTLLFACAISHAQTPELIVQAGHTNSVHTVAFSPDGRTILSAGADHTLKLWEAATGRLIRNFEGQGDIYDDARAVFSPDGKLIASISTADYIKLWDVGSGKLVRELDDAAKESTASISGALAFSPDGKLLAAQTDKFKVWDVASGTLVRTLDGYAGAARFGPDGNVLAEVTVDSKLNLWDVSGGRLLRTLEASALRVPDGISFSPDGKTLAVLRQGAVDLWDTSGWRVVRSLKTAATQTDGAVIAFGPDGKKLFVSNAGHGGGFQRSLELWDVVGGNLSRSINVKDGYDERPVFADSVSFSPDGQSFVTGGDEQIILWGVERGEVVRAFGPNRYSDEEKSARLTIFPERGTVAVVTGRQAKLWDANTGLICSLAGSGARLDLTPRNVEGNVIALNNILWDARSCHRLGRIDDAYTLAFSHDGRAVAQIAGSSIKLYDATFQPLRVLRGHTGDVGIITFSPDSKLLASGGADNTIRLWDWETGQSVRAFEGHTGYVSALAFSPDGKLLASGGNDRTVRLWDVATGRLLNTLAGHAGRVSALAFSPDGKVLASGAMADKTLRLWDVQTGKLLQSFGGHPSGATDVAFSPDGAALATWWKTERKDQNIVKLWRVEDGQLVLDLQDLSLKSAAFSREGHTLIVASGDEYRDVRTRIYSSASGGVLADVIGFTDGRWIVITPSGFFDGPPEVWSRVAWRFGGNQVAPAELFFNDFYYPGLLAEVLAGRTPPAVRSIGQLDRRQPKIKVSTADGAAGSLVTARELKLKLEVEDNFEGDAKTGGGAFDLRLFRNGTLVRVWRGDVLKGRRAAAFDVTLPVVAGENNLTAYAFNRDNIKSEDATLVVTGADSLRRAGTAYVVAVGVNSYENPRYNLKYAVADAQDFAEEVRRQQAQLGRYDRVEVVPLTDSDATKANILAALKILAGANDPLPANAPKPLAQLKRAAPEDTVVVYFAGHGTAQKNRFYLIPHDLGYAGGRDSLDAAGLQTILSHSVSDEELQSAFEGLDAGQLLFVIDACNSGQALEAEEKRRGPMNSKGLAQLAYEKGMYILTAAQSFQAAQEASQLGHGLLTYALVDEGLKQGKADDEPRDGDVLIREWLDYATARVPEMQVEEMRRAAERGVKLAFKDEERELALKARSPQVPRVFYRRESEAKPLVIAKPGGAGLTGRRARRYD